MQPAQNNLLGEPFYCINCKGLVPVAEYGTGQRNHCPKCLWSQHVDFQLGDRRSACKSGMEAISVSVNKKAEWSIIHRCTKCSALRLNRIAGDDNELLLLSLAVQPIARPAFPLDRLAK